MCVVKKSFFSSVWNIENQKIKNKKPTMNLLLELKTALECFHKTLLFTIPLILLLLCIASRIHRKTALYPPCPKGLPLIGNMNIMKQLTHKGLANLVVVGDKNLKNAVKVFVDRLAIKVENGVEGFEGFVGQIGFNVGFD